MQSFGKTGNPHPHLHGLIANGLFDNEGNFHEVKKISQDTVRELFKNKLFEILLERDIIYEETINIFSSWRHSGFDVHYERRIDGNDEVEIIEAAEKRRKNKYWARLIQKLFLTNPLQCSKCSSEMKIIAFIQEQPIVKKILNHPGLLNNHDPSVLKPPPKSYNHNSGYIPSVDDYIRDPDPEIFYPDHVYEDF